MNVLTETAATFACFGSHCSVHVIGSEPEASDAVTAARAQLLAWHDRFTRFAPGSELSRLNADPRAVVEVSRPLALLALAAADAARATGGLVDATLLGAIESAGYRSDLRGSLPLALALCLAPARRPAAASRAQAWRDLRADPIAGTVTRPPGLMLDSGGLAKGLFADLLAERLADHEGFAVDCAGDLRIGGVAGLERRIDVTSPFDGSTLHSFGVDRGGVATSGIGRRSWLDADGRPAHHLLDPSTGRPAFTGIVQATALAPTALTAESRSKAALLSGPDGARDWLGDGGVLVFDDGRHEVVEPDRP